MEKEFREKVWNKFNKHCAYCGKILKGYSGKYMHVDEMKPIIRDLEWNKKGQLVTGKTCKYPERLNFDNQVPACPQCNINKHSLSIEDFRQSIYQYVESLNKYSTQYKMASKYGLIKETGNKIVFYFEKHNGIDIKTRSEPK